MTNSETKFVNRVVKQSNLLRKGSMMNSPFDVVVDYTVDMGEPNWSQQFVLFRCGMLLLIHTMSSNEQNIQFGEVECSPDEFLDSIKEEERKVREESFNPKCLDWSGWWDSIKFQYANYHDYNGNMVVPEWMIKNINKKEC